MKWWRRPRRTQLELPLERAPEPDRNFARGGRSFYFFDFDDNVAFLTTPTYLFHRETGAEIELSSREFAVAGAMIGKAGVYADYVIDHDPRTGSFRCFRDADASWLARTLGHRQVFERDLAHALTQPELTWKGPSWDCFYHAVFNGRPVALITARGHAPRTIKNGIRLWVDEGHLPAEPNYLGIYPVSHLPMKAMLNSAHDTDVARLKQLALRHAVEKAFRTYGRNPHHRFGMSDDDPRNVEWITAEMRVLKRENPQNSFFIIQTCGGTMIKHEVFEDYVVEACVDADRQLSLFDE